MENASAVGTAFYDGGSRKEKGVKKGGERRFCLAKLLALSLSVVLLDSFHLLSEALPRSLSMIIRRRMNFHLNNRVMFARRHVLALFFNDLQREKEKEDT